MFDYQRILGAGLGGFIVGAVTAAHGAVKTGSEHVIKSAAILGSGMGLFVAAESAAGYSAPTANKKDLHSLATGLALMELAGGVIGYAAYMLAIENASSSLPVTEFGLNMAKGYPFALALIFLLQMYRDYAREKEIAETGHAEMERIYVTKMAENYQRLGSKS